MVVSVRVMTRPSPSTYELELEDLPEPPLEE